MTMLLAVDLGLRTGLALYHRDGRLAWHGSKHFGNPASLKQAVHRLISSKTDVNHVVMEGGGVLGEIWESACQRKGLVFKRIGAEAWRPLFFKPSELIGRAKAKRSAVAMARRVIEWSDAPQTKALRHDAAEAILVGLWGVIDAGWLEKLPAELR